MAECEQCEINKDWIAQLMAKIEEQNELLNADSIAMRKANNIIITQGRELEILAVELVELRNTMNMMAMLKNRGEKKLSLVQ